jgi:predicted phage replisome organizer
MADVKWIKIAVDIFDDEKILLVEQMPEGYAIITVWFKLLCLAGKQNNSGVFVINNKIPYTEEMFATIFRMPLNIVRLALTTFERFGMVEIINDTITIPKWGKHQSLDKIEKHNEYMRKYMANYREKQKRLASGEACKPNSKVNSKPNVNALELELEQEQELKKKSTKHKHGEYNNVLLSDEDLEKLKAEFTDWEERIERLSEYIESKGVKYKSHLATIRSWARKEQPKAQENHGLPPGYSAVLSD